MSQSTDAMDLDQRSGTKRLSQEEYLVDDPFLKWVRPTKEALERHLAIAMAKDDDGSLFPDIQHFKSLENSYTALAGDIASGRSETIILSKLPNASMVMDGIKIIAGRDGLEGAPQWVQMAGERSRRQEGGKQDMISLMRGWRNEVQVDVKLDDIFRAALGSDPEPKGTAASLEDAEALREDFQKPFLGSADQMLRLHVESHMGKGGNRAMVYANVIPILQSSGFGKSKTVTQLSATNLGLFVCVRAATLNRVSQPPADSSVLPFLQEDLSSRGHLTVFRKTRIVAVWLIAMAEEMASFYTEEWKKFQEEHCDDRAAFITHVGDVLSPSQAPLSRGSTPPRRKASTTSSANHRDRVLNAIAEKATALRKEPRYSTAAYDRTRRRRDSGRKRKADDSTSSASFEIKEDPGMTSDDTEYVKARPAPSNVSGGLADEAQLDPEALSRYSATAEFFQNDLHKAFAHLESCLPEEPRGSGGERKYFFHLAIDECGKMASRLAVIRRLWSLIGVSRCFLFLLDTNTQISLTYGQESVDSSLRLKTGEKALLPPFTRLPQDLALRQDISSYLQMVNGDTIVSHANVSAWLPKMGRPLLNDQWLLTSSAGDPDPVKLSDKLLPYSTVEPFRRIETCIALALHRMSLSLVGKQVETGDTYKMGPRASLKFAEEQVASYMRRLKDVTTRGELIITAGSSEPLLSMSAAFLFRDDPTRNWSSTIGHMRSARTEFNVEMGIIGEELVQVLAHAAADVAAANDNRHLPATSSAPALPIPLHLARLYPVNLKDFLDTLFFADAPPADNLRSLREWASGYWINFTHIAKAPALYYKNGHLLNRGYVAQLWTRQAAIVGQNTQPDWDLLIPIYKSSAMPIGSALFNPANISFLPIQVKNKVNGDVSKANTNFATDTAEPQDIKVHPGRATIWFDLKGSTEPCEISHERQTSERQKNDNPRPEVFHITARGHTGQAINVVNLLTAEAQLIIPELLGVIEGVSEPGFLDKTDEDWWNGLCPSYRSSSDSENATK